MKDFYNTVIIGAGPGGLIAGRLLEDALILDQKQEIGRPIQCGEIISQSALDMQGIKPDLSWISCGINMVQRIVPNGKIIGTLHKNYSGYIIDRHAFENFLAKDLKAQLKLNTWVANLKKQGDFWEITTQNSEIFKSKYLIGADGFNSIVRRLVFRQEVEIIPALDYLIELEKEIDTLTAKFYLDNEKFSNGYAWISPKSKNTANIGLCGNFNISERFKIFLEEIVEKNYGNYKILENKSGAIPFKKNNAKFFKDNAFLVGDAAGLADPIFKGGMNQAMLSAKIAAECIIKNEADFYESKIKSMPFTSPKLAEASKKFYSFNNQTLNELGDVLNEKKLSYLKTFSGVKDVLTKPNLRKNFFKVLKFFSIWKKNKDYLW